MKRCKFCQKRLSWIRITRIYCDDICKRAWHMEFNLEYRERRIIYTVIWIKQKRLKEKMDKFVDDNVKPDLNLDGYTAYTATIEDEQDEMWD